MAQTKRKGFQTTAWVAAHAVYEEEGTGKRRIVSRVLKCLRGVIAKPVEGVDNALPAVMTFKELSSQALKCVLFTFIYGNCNAWSPLALHLLAPS